MPVHDTKETSTRPAATKDWSFYAVLAARIASGAINFERDGMPGVSLPRGQGTTTSHMDIYYATNSPAAQAPQASDESIATTPRLHV